MKKWRVTELNTIAYVYEVEASNEQEAERKVLDGEAEHLPEYDTHTEREFEFEDITKRYPNRKYRVSEG